MARGTNLNKAKKAKNDEFYTQLTDIEKELKHYKQHFKDKVVFCNCDDPEWSNFYKYFYLNFEELGLKKLICTHYDKEEPTYKLEIERDINGDGIIDKGDEIKTPLEGNGDFRNAECIELLKEADIVVTNPPFSLFREYLSQLIEYNKKFLIIGNVNVRTGKLVFPLLKNNQMWIGYNTVKNFLTPDGTIQSFGNICWYTNLDISKRYEDLILWRHYYDNNGNPIPDVKNLYLPYYNYDAINVDTIKDIPCDYNGVMGVPISIFDNYNPEQFEILDTGEPAILLSDLRLYKNNFKEFKSRQITIDGQICQKTYFRIFIKRKK